MMGAVGPKTGFHRPDSSAGHPPRSKGVLLHVVASVLETSHPRDRWFAVSHPSGSCKPHRGDEIRWGHLALYEVVLRPEHELKGGRADGTRGDERREKKGDGGV